MSARRPILVRLERLLWLASFIALVTAGWMWADSWLYQRVARAELAEAMASLDDTGEGSGDAQPAGDSLHAVPGPASEGMPVATLEIPRLDLSVVVAEGTTSRVLRRAVGRLARSARPGEIGNIALAGHRDTFFRPLEDVSVGDLIWLDSAAGRHGYQVEWVEVVSPAAVELVSPTDYAALTLVTCYPFRYVGNAPERFVVRARRVHGREASDILASAPIR